MADFCMGCFKVTISFDQQWLIGRLEYSILCQINGTFIFIECLELKFYTIFSVFFLVSVVVASSKTHPLEKTAQ